jgi:hypothetical protein
MAYGKQAKESTLLSPSMKISRKIDKSGCHFPAFSFFDRSDFQAEKKSIRDIVNSLYLKTAQTILVL